MKSPQSSAPRTLGAHPPEIDEKDIHLLEQAAEKLVLFGMQVGVPHILIAAVPMSKNNGLNALA